MRLIGNVLPDRNVNRIIRRNGCQLDFFNQVNRKELGKPFEEFLCLLNCNGFTDDRSIEWLGIWANGKSVNPHSDDALTEHTAIWVTQCTKLAWLLSTSTPIKHHSEIIIKEGDVWIFDSRSVHALLVDPKCRWTLLVNDVIKI